MLYLNIALLNYVFYNFNRINKNINLYLQIRVQTPPRVITLNDHYFPTVEDDDDLFDRDSGPTSEKSNSSAQLSHSKIIVPMNQW